MALMKELLSSDVGILSLITIVVTCVVVGTAITFFIKSPTNSFTAYSVGKIHALYA